MVAAGAMQVRQIASIGSLSHPHKNTKYELWMKRREENRLQVEEAEEGRRERRPRKEREVKKERKKGRGNP